jgi:hypothetical protein
MNRGDDRILAAKAASEHSGVRVRVGLKPEKPKD